MSASPSLTAVREAAWLDRSYVTARRRATNVSQAWIRSLVAVTWGLPAAPLLIRAVGGDVSSRAWVFALGAAILFGVMAAEDDVARRSPFEALRFPDAGALFVARFLRRRRWLLWVGACLGALRAVQMLDAGAAAPVTCALAGALLALAPAQLLAARTAQIAAESIHPSPDWGWFRRGLMIGTALAAASLAARGVRDSFGTGIIVALLLYGTGYAASFAHAPTRFASTVADFAWLAATSSVAFGKFRGVDRDTSTTVDVAIVVYLVYALVAPPLYVRWASRRPPVFARVKESDAEESSAEGVPGAVQRPLARPAPGAGLWRAAWRRRWLWFRNTIPHRRSLVLPWLVFTAPLWAAWFGRSVAAAMALVLWADAPGVPWSVCALATALFAPTIVAEGMSERLLLLGVEPRRLVLHDLRALALMGAAPALLAALVAAWARDFDPVSLGVCATLASLFVLRAGWSALWRGHSVLVTAIALLAGIPAAVAFGPAPHAALPWAAATFVLGAVGVLRRVTQSTESLREQMRLATD